MKDILSFFYKDKKVLITGHTGFKGSWLCEMLLSLGANVCGYSHPSIGEGMFSSCDLTNKIIDTRGDITDYAKLMAVFNDFEPEIIFHLAAQPLVSAGYTRPLETFNTNIMGTATVLECVRKTPSVRSVVNITTDKVYQNQEMCWGYRETDNLGGYDPYSCSKSCSELITKSYRQRLPEVSISTARAGNVIGGGDFAADRIIPDCIRAIIAHKNVEIRNPNSVRPYQHVIEALYAYLLIAMEQYENTILSDDYNVGPDEYTTTIDLVKEFLLLWNDATTTWELTSDIPFKETNILKLDCSKIKSKISWKPIWNTSMTIQKTYEWYKSWYTGMDVHTITTNQIREFLSEV